MDDAQPRAQPSRSTAANIGGTVAAIAAVAAGRLFGWAFGLRFVLPIVAALVVLSVMKKRLAPEMQPLAPALGAHAALLTFSILDAVASWFGHGFHFAPMWLALQLVSIGVLVWGIAQPGLAPVAMLLARDGYALVMCLLGLPRWFDHDWSPPLALVLPAILTGVLAAMAVYLAAIAAKAFQRQSA
jgi:hypothetical protein